MRRSVLQVTKRLLSSSSSGNATSPPFKTLLVLGSTRSNRIGKKVADYVACRMQERGCHEILVLDPRESFDGFFMRLMEKAYFHYKPSQGDLPPPRLQAAAAMIKSADAIVVISPEYNHTISPAITNTLNYFGASMYKNKPSGIVTYSAGAWAGARAGVALRPYLSELGCLPVSAMMQLPWCWKSDTWVQEDGRAMLQEGSMAEKSCLRMLDQLEWYARVCREQRKADLQQGL